MFAQNTSGQENKYKLLLNDSEVKSAQEKVDQIKTRNNNVATHQALNELKTALHEVEALHNEKKALQEKYNTLTYIKESLRSDAKSNIKNITKEQAKNKFNELNTLNNEIKNALNQLEQNTFSELSPKSKEFYKTQIKNVDGKGLIQFILNSAKADVEINKFKKQTKEKIEKLGNISTNGIASFKNRIDNALNKDQINIILNEAEALNNSKDTLIAQINEAYALQLIKENNKNDLIRRLKSDDSERTKQAIQGELDRLILNLTT